MKTQLDYNTQPGSTTTSIVWRRRVRCAVERTVLALVLGSVASCASLPSGQSSSADSGEEVWREVPKTSPLLQPEIAPSPAPAPTSNRKLAESDLPVIDPLRKPIDVSVKQPAQASLPAQIQEASQPSVGKVADASAEVGISRKAPTQKAPSNNSSVKLVETPDSSKNQNVTQTAKQNTAPAPAKTEAPKTTVASSDIELMCTEVVPSVSIGADGCAILDGSIEGVGFLPNSAELTTSAQQVLDSVANVMKKKKNLRLSVATYSNDLDESKMGKLSQRRRTLAVIRHLIDAGIEGGRVRPHTAPRSAEFGTEADISQYLVVLRNAEQ